MIILDCSDTDKLKDLYPSNRMDAMLSWFFNRRRHCKVWVDYTENPETAVILVADFCYLIGKVKTPEDIVTVLLEDAHNKVIIAAGPDWVLFLNQYLNGKVYCYKRYALKHEPDVFDRKRLLQYINCIDPAYEIRKINEPVYHEVMAIDWAADGCCYYDSYEDFDANGLGYVIYKNGVLVCIASSYSSYEGGIAVTIGTLEEYRRQRLATACAASLILDCLDHNIYPEWEAANMASVALAEKLGYHFDGAFDVYSLI